MKFLVLLLVIWVEKFSAWRRYIQHDGHWLNALAQIEARPRSGARAWGALLLLVLVPVVLLALILVVLKPVAYGWLALPVHLLVLVYSLGRGDIQAILGPFRDAWRRGDRQAALHVAERDLQVVAQEPDDLLQQAQAWEVWQAYQGFFAVIFWYALLGPAAALAYRLLALSEEHAGQLALRERAGQLRHAFDWLPVRLLAGSFALVGHFSAVCRTVLPELLVWDKPAQQLMADAARAACEFSPSADDTVGVESLDTLWQLLVRAAVLWYVGFAVWILLV
jgi:AmpE protein